MSELSAAVMLVAGGLFAGGAATFVWSRVPIWRRMPLSQFVGDFDETIRRTDIVQPALAVVAAVAAIAFAVTASGSARLLAALGAVGFIAVLVASFAVLVPLQRRIIAAPLASKAEIDAMRLRWFSGNVGRTVLAVASFEITVLATTL
jgi:hypothetical protein